VEVLAEVLVFPAVPVRAVFGAVASTTAVVVRMLGGAAGGLAGRRFVSRV